MTTNTGATVSLCVIGGGFMGEAIVDGLLKAGTARVEDICVGEQIDERRHYLQQKFVGLTVKAELTQAVVGRQIVLLAVKPQDVFKVASDLRGDLDQQQLLMSIMAGVRVDTLMEAFDHNSVVRVMPNTPAALGAGFSGWFATMAVADEQRVLAQRVLRALGREAQVPEERYLDMVTALSGSGPAYVFLFLEGLIDAGVHIGLPRGLATEMALQTLLGSTRMAIETGRHPAELRNMVTSPAGTTAEALLVLERAGMRAALTEAVIAAYEKSRALGG